jgi:hypothetical protein
VTDQAYLCPFASTTRLEGAKGLSVVAALSRHAARRPAVEAASKSLTHARYAEAAEGPMKRAPRRADILIVDDTPANFDVLSAMLERKGHRPPGDRGGDAGLYEA